MATAKTVHCARVRAFRVACLNRDLTAAQFAAKRKVTRQAVYNVVSGLGRNRQLEDALLRQFPEVFNLYPFEHQLKKLAQPSVQRNRTDVQEGKGGGSTTRRKAKSRKRRAS